MGENKCFKCDHDIPIGYFRRKCGKLAMCAYAFVCNIEMVTDGCPGMLCKKCWKQAFKPEYKLFSSSYDNDYGKDLYILKICDPVCPGGCGKSLPSYR